VNQPHEKPSQALLDLARRVGLEPDYYDALGNHRVASVAALEHVLASLGWPLDDGVEEAAKIVDADRWREGLPPVSALFFHDERHVSFVVARSRADEAAQATLSLEGGSFFLPPQGGVPPPGGEGGWLRREVLGGVWLVW